MPPTKQNPRENIKLLIVEDDRTYRILAAESLQSVEDYTVHRMVADTAKAGLDLFRREKPDITLLDIQLPDGSGISLLEACMQCNPKAFIVMMTSSANANDVHRAKEVGAKGYILKPFNIKKIQEIMGVYEARNSELRPKESLVNNPLIDVDSLFEKEEDTSQLEPSAKDIIADWNILFADDYLTNCDNAKRNLSRFKCNVETVTTGEEALKKIKQKHFQLMLLDTSLQDINGYRLAMNVRSEDRDKPLKSYLIGMMRNLDEAQEKRWLQVGMNDFLIKPCSFAALEKILVKYAKKYKNDLDETFLS